jgi:RNA polymerase sigma factor (sigma-70 family)
MEKSDLADKSDEDLMEIYKMGNAIAFEILFERHSSRVLGYLSKRLKFPKEAQDLLQEVFFKLHRSRHLYNRTLPFSPWLFSITRSIWLDFLKKRQLEDATEQEQLERMAFTTQEFEISASNAGTEILSQLPSNQKEAVSLRVYDEATFEEIAIKLSTSPENARQLVSRGLKRLKMILGSRKE